MTRLNVYNLAYPVRSLGPGLRAVVWVAGCGRRCPGCISPEMQDPGAGRMIGTGTLARRVTGIGLPLTGLTVSGGEPLDQARSLADFLHKIRRARPKWDVLIYSGYLLTEIEDRIPGGPEVLALADVLVDGPYVAEAPAVHPLAGSGNQEVHLLSPRAQALARDYGNPPPFPFELGLGPGNFALLVGVGRPDLRRRVHRELGLESQKEGRP
ncbi:MAG: 4Fe-4S single cluster domain-containing protein [Thermodesulfobacteriota bacterium]